MPASVTQRRGKGGGVRLEGTVYDFHVTYRGLLARVGGQPSGMMGGQGPMGNMPGGMMGGRGSMGGGAYGQGGMGYGNGLCDGICINQTP